MDALRGQFSKNLRELRTSLGFSQAEAAEGVGLAPETYGRLERGSVLPRVGTLIRLALLFNVSTDYLLGLPAPPTHAGEELGADLNRLIRVAEKLPVEAQQRLADFIRSLNLD